MAAQSSAIIEANFFILGAKILSVTEVVKSQF